MVSKTHNLSDLNDLEVVASTIWGEARGEGVKGMTAVGCVIQNRVNIGGWFGNCPREVCLKLFQFSAWNTDNPNRPRMLSVTMADPDYRIATSIANSVLTGTLNDITDGADSYEVRGTGAYWAKNLTPVAQIGKHDFYVARTN
jgi:spore germination cell wall hydrolase CwlJ-like protein